MVRQLGDFAVAKLLHHLQSDRSYATAVTKKAELVKWPFLKTGLYSSPLFQKVEQQLK